MKMAKRPRRPHMQLSRGTLEKDARSYNGRPESESKSVIELGPAIRARIGEQLRLIYDEVVKQEVPERFVEILRRGDLPTDGGSKNRSS